MAEYVRFTMADAPRLQWPARCVHCGEPAAVIGAGARPAVVACARHARAQAFARRLLDDTPSGRLLLMVACVGTGLLVKFLAMSAFAGENLPGALGALGTGVQVFFAAGLLATIALVWADRTARVRFVVADLRGHVGLLKFRDAAAAAAFRALNGDLVQAAPAPLWLRGSTTLGFGVIVLLALALAALHALRAH